MKGVKSRKEEMNGGELVRDRKTRLTWLGCVVGERRTREPESLESTVSVRAFLVRGLGYEVKYLFRPPTTSSKREHMFSGRRTNAVALGACRLCGQAHGTSGMLNRMKGPDV